MKIFHGSLEIVEFPEIRKPNRTLDYGYGFYATTSFEQAESWVKRKMSEQKKGKGYVNVYEFNQDSLHDLNALLFPLLTEEWVDFVMKNRTRKNYVHEFDVVYGPVANDKVYAAFGLFEGGFIDKQMLIAELKAYKLVDQYLFHTPKSLSYLKFIEAKEVV